MRKTAFIAFAGMSCMAPSAPSVRTIDGSGIVAGSINSVPARIQIDPAALAIPIVSADIAKKAGLRSSLMEFEYRVGPRIVTGKSGVGSIDIGTGPIKRRIGWTGVPPRPGVADGAIGPGLLPEDIVQFRLRTKQRGERTADFPLVGQGGIDARWAERYALIKIGGDDLRIHFDPNTPTTVATAPAGAILAVALDGIWEGAPREASIAYGISRPVRTLALSRPLIIGPLVLQRVPVRTHDFGSTTAIPDTAADPNEITVLASKKANPVYRVVRLGADALARCSSITFNKKAKRVTLSCV